MKVLQHVEATAEQLMILRHAPRGSLIVRGAAGSGKTTTALLRLRVVLDFWQRQFARMGRRLNVLVLTFNRTLAGYIHVLAAEQVSGFANVDLDVDTFSGWATRRLGVTMLLGNEDRIRKLRELVAPLGLPDRFARDEIDYVSGRFLPEQLDTYLGFKREGRGLAPQMPQRQRERLLTEVLAPYAAWKQGLRMLDWNDVATALARQALQPTYDVVVVDETQDFQANQVRAIMRHLSPQHSITFVLDSAQRIYPHLFRWNEVDVPTAPPDGAVIKLSRNYRNTRQIAAFAGPIIDGVEVGPDGTLPDFQNASAEGPLPVVLRGKFGAQMRWAVEYIRARVDLRRESVCFLHPKGGGWFDEVRAQLAAAGLSYEELTREKDWPRTPTNIALCTMHSAKGLEFDHVLILGLNAEVTPHGQEQGDSELESLRRLLTMAVGRAKKGLLVGYKPADASRLIGLLKEGTFDLVDVA